MKAPIVLIAVVALTLPGCAGVVMADATRKESRAAIAKVMVEERPGLDSAAAAVCVQKAMTLVEAAKLGTADNYPSVSSENRTAILGYAARPDAAACLDALPVAEVAG
ncbi:MAG: hypothetical protein H5U18_05470 [Rhodobacteraceae bacterium]|nr:hypothetical protein [Paracoccaceae bacterium]